MPHSIGKSSHTEIEQFHLYASNNMRKRSFMHAHKHTSTHTHACMHMPIQINSNQIQRWNCCSQSIEYLLQTLIVTTLCCEYISLNVAGHSLYLSNYTRALSASKYANYLVEFFASFSSFFFIRFFVPHNKRKVKRVFFLLSSCTFVCVCMCVLFRFVYRNFSVQIAS